MKNKLEIKHIASYLPYGLRVQTEDGIYRVCGWSDEIGIMLDTIDYGFNAVPHYKLVLRPINDLGIEFMHNGKRKVIADYRDKKLSVAVYVNYMNTLFEHHFDVFGLIEKGLAVDIKQTYYEKNF